MSGVMSGVGVVEVLGLLRAGLDLRPSADDQVQVFGAARDRLVAGPDCVADWSGLAAAPDLSDPGRRL